MPSRSRRRPPPRRPGRVWGRRLPLRLRCQRRGGQRVRAVPTPYPCSSRPAPGGATACLVSGLWERRAGVRTCTRSGRTPGAVSSSGAASPRRCAGPRSMPLSPGPRGAPQLPPRAGSDPGTRWTAGCCAPREGRGRLRAAGRGLRGGLKEGVPGVASLYLLGTAGGSHWTPLPTGVCGSGLVSLNKMQMSGTRPTPFSPWPTQPHGGLQVLEDDSAVVAEHIWDTAGVQLGPDWCDPQQRQQERPKRNLGGHLEGSPGQGRAARTSPPAPVGSLPRPPPPPTRGKPLCHPAGSRNRRGRTNPCRLTAAS